MTGYADGPPAMPEIPYTDYTAGEHTVYAVMAALMHRLRTGQGQFIDISQTQTASATVPEALMDFAVNGRIQSRLGNQHSSMAPHGCYPCLGDDRWIAIAVGDDNQWRALCRVLGQEAWAEDPRFSQGLTRWDNRLELDELVAVETKNWQAHRLMSELQAQGVAAGAVLDSKDLLFDPHLKEREFYEVVSHHSSTNIPPLPYASRPWKLTGTPAMPGRAAPLMGEHNKRVLGELLCQSDEQMAELERQGIIGYAPVNPRPVQRPPLDEQVRQGRMQRYETDFKLKVSQAFPPLSKKE